MADLVARCGVPWCVALLRRSLLAPAPLIARFVLHAPRRPRSQVNARGKEHSVCARCRQQPLVLAADPTGRAGQGAACGRACCAAQDGRGPVHNVTLRLASDSEVTVFLLEDGDTKAGTRSP